MQRWITNSYKYLFFIKDVFKQNGLPTDLAYLPLAESGFDVKVRSRAGAVGMWQFMEQTGKLYGLHVDYWVDERRDFEKSTYAAARHLKDLYDRFKDWNLALAAYNAGAGRIQKAIDRFNTDDYFELTGYSNLAEETKDYVPKYIALMMIHKNLPYYGFEYPEVEPVAYEKVKIDFPVNLYVLSKIVGLELDTLINLNPSLRRWITPPNSTFELKVPIGFKEKIESALNEYSHEELLQVRIYVPNRKEKVVTIAKKYNVSPAQIMAINGFRKGIVKAGFPVIVPSEKGNIVVSPRQQQAIAKSISGAGFESDEKSRISSYKIYTVKKGDTLSSIAKKNKTTVSAIKSLNKIKVLKTGLKLKVPDKYITAQKLSSRNKIKTTVPAKKHFISYKVKRGDTIWKLADQYNTQPKEIIKINNIKNLKPGQTIIIPKSKI
jgi:membrane-bound lytic murein transglycosylase D